MLNCQKELFSLPDNIHYLNCAYKSPLLKAGELASIQALQRQRNPGHLTEADFFDQSDRIRSLFAELTNSTSQNIAIIPSTSYGYSSILNNIRGKSNGNAVTNLHEFPSGYYCLERWCSENEQQLIVVQKDNQSINANDWNEKIIDAITENTSVVLISSIHWMNGYQFDLEAIGRRCREMDTVFIVDGTQSVGALPIDVNQSNIDLLVCASYKWAVFHQQEIASDSCICCHRNHELQSGAGKAG